MDIFRSQNLKIPLAGLIESQYFGLSTLKFIIWDRNLRFGWKAGALGSAWGDVGKRNGHWRRPFWRHGVAVVGLGLFSGSLWAAPGATLGAKKTTRGAPRRVTGAFGGPRSLWKGPGLVLRVVFEAEKTILKG